jgi:hypothetical protein
MEPSPVVATPLSRGKNRRSVIVIIVCIIAFLAALAVGIYFWLRPVTAHPILVDFVSSSGDQWYVLTGDELRPASTSEPDRVIGSDGAVATSVFVPVATHASAVPQLRTPKTASAILLTQKDGTSKKLGLGRPLGFLPDGSLLALTPLGLSKVTRDGVSYQLVNAGGDGSTTPIGVARKDLSLVAFQNFITRTVVVYQFDAATLSAKFIGSAKLPTALSPQIASTTPEEEATTTRDTTSTYPQLPVSPGMIGLTETQLFIRSTDGQFYGFPISVDGIGTVAPYFLNQRNVVI